MPDCPHFGDCGGCAFLDVEYPDQVEVKRRRLEALFERDVPFTPSPDVVYYRNRMDFSIGPSGAGLFRRGSWRHTVDLRSCLLMAPDAVDVLRFASAEIARAGLAPYDRAGRTGFVRYLVLREAKATGERIASLVTAAGPDDPSGVCEAIAGRFGLHGVLWQVNDRRADLSRGEIRRVWGRDRFEERFDDVSVTVLANAFLQPNTRAATLLYRDLRERVPAGSALLDLYCGVGAIGLFVQDRCARTVGVDVDPDNIEAARANAAAAEFACEDAGRVSLDGFDVLVLDPPRAGLHPKLAKRIAAEGPGLVLYVSCNPDALKRDLALLPGYRLEELRGYDFCPHTRHVEALAALRR